MTLPFSDDIPYGQVIQQDIETPKKESAKAMMDSKI